MLWPVAVNPEKGGKTEMTLNHNLSLVHLLLLVLLPNAAATVQLEETRTIKLQNNPRTVAWHPDSKMLAAGGWAGSLGVWDSRTGKKIMNLGQPDNAQLSEIQYSRDGMFLVVGKSMPGGNQPYVSIFDSKTFQIIDQLDKPSAIGKAPQSSGVTSLSVDPADSKRIAISSYLTDTTPAIFTVSSVPRKVIQADMPSNSIVTNVVFSPNGKFVAIGRLNGQVDFIAAENMKPVGSFSAMSSDWLIRDLIFSPDSRYVYVASNTGAVRGFLDRTTGVWVERRNIEPIKMWDVETKALIRVFETQGRDIQSLDVSPNGQYLYAGLSNGQVVIWNTNSGVEVKRFKPSRNYTIVKISPNGKWLATSDTGTSILRIWSIVD